jgi:D-galactarolactone cycloisomerase
LVAARLADQIGIGTPAEANLMHSVKITSIVAAPLFGDSPKGGWSTEIQPEDSIHALIAVHT